MAVQEGYVRKACRMKVSLKHQKRFTDLSFRPNLFFQVRFGDKDLLGVPHFLVSFHSSAFFVHGFENEQTCVLGHCEQVLIVKRHAHLENKDTVSSE